MGNEAKPINEVPTEEQVEALLEAARYDDLDDIKGLESAGIPLGAKDSQGRTAEVLEDILQEKLDSRPENLFGALHMAAANGHHGIVEYLISKGVDLDALNEEKNTPLHWACLNGHTEVVKTLILAGANVAALNSHERAPIDEALSRGKMDIIDVFNEAVAQLELGQARV